MQDNGAFQARPSTTAGGLPSLCPSGEGTVRATRTSLCGSTPLPVQGKHTGQDLSWAVFLPPSPLLTGGRKGFQDLGPPSMPCQGSGSPVGGPVLPGPCDQWRSGYVQLSWHFQWGSHSTRVGSGLPSAAFCCLVRGNVGLGSASFVGCRDMQSTGIVLSL